MCEDRTGISYNQVGRPRKPSVRWVGAELACHSRRSYSQIGYHALSSRTERVIDIEPYLW